MRIIYESRQRLTEDKIVKVGGEMYPKDGWALILMGGGGSGKGTVLNSLIPFEGKYMNVDDLKENPRFWDIKHNFGTEEEPSVRSYWDEVRRQGEIKGINVENVRQMGQKDYIGAGKKFFAKEDEGRPAEVANLGDSKALNLLHTTLKDKREDTGVQMGLNKRLKDYTYATGNDIDFESGKPVRLPNIIFDITASEVKDLYDIVEALRDKHYKIAGVWVFSTFSGALANNKKRDRQVADSILANLHSGVIDSVRELFLSGLIKQFSDFWIVDSNAPESVFKDKQAYHDFQNCYRVPCTPDGLNVFMDKYLNNPYWMQGYEYTKSIGDDTTAPLNVRSRMVNTKREIYNSFPEEHGKAKKARKDGRDLRWQADMWNQEDNL